MDDEEDDVVGEDALRPDEGKVSPADIPRDESVVDPELGHRTSSKTE